VSVNRTHKSQSNTRLHWWLLLQYLISSDTQWSRRALNIIKCCDDTSSCPALPICCKNVATSVGGPKCMMPCIAQKFTPMTATVVLVSMTVSLTVHYLWSYQIISRYAINIRWCFLVVHLYTRTATRKAQTRSFGTRLQHLLSFVKKLSVIVYLLSIMPSNHVNQPFKYTVSSSR